MLALTWFEYAVASTFFTAIFWLSCRSLMKKEGDHQTFAIYMQFGPIVFWLPLLAFEPFQPAVLLDGWVWLILAALVWALQQLLAFKSLHTTSASVREPIYQSKLVWAALFAFLLLGEAFAFGKLLGVALLLAGALIIAYRQPPGESTPHGFLLVVGSAAMTGLGYVLDKLALFHFSVTLYAIVVSVLAGLIIVAHESRYGGLPKIVPFIRRHPKAVLVASFTGAVSYWLQIKAVSLGPVGTIAALLELSMVFTTLGGIVFLHERQAIGRKLVGVALAIAGALVLRGFISF